MTLFFLSSRRGFSNVPCLLLFSAGPCTIDLAFIIDSSGSIGFRNWYRLKNVLKGLLKYINVGPNGTHVAMVLYSDNAEVAFKFNTLQGSQITIENYEKYINKLRWLKGLTHMNRGLMLARELFTVEAGMRPNVSKVSAATSFVVQPVRLVAPRPGIVCLEYEDMLEECQHLSYPFLTVACGA